MNRPCVTVEEMFRLLDGRFGRLAYWAYTDQDDPSRVLVRGHYAYIPEAEQFLREQGFTPECLDGNTVALRAHDGSGQGDCS